MTSQAGPQDAIIIPHYNDVARLCRLLEALETQDRTGSEVIVADNGSTVDLGPVADRFPWVRIVSEPASGAGLARNKGAAATTAPWLFFIDADCLPEPDWLNQARRIARGDRDVITGGRVDVFDETPPPRSGAEAFETVFAFQMQRYLEEEGFLGAGNLVVARESFDMTGGFRAAVSEDKEWSQRAAAAGFRLAYDDALAVGHPSRQDYAALSRKWHRVVEESWALQRHGDRPDWLNRLFWAGRACLMPASVLLHIGPILRHPALSTRERARAIVTLARIRIARMGWMLGHAIMGK
jgi:GT2 family glycosyltransferase